jgi:hypothetical protein
VQLVYSALMALHAASFGAQRRMVVAGQHASVLGMARRLWSEIAEARGLDLVTDPESVLRFEGAIRGVRCELSLLEDPASGFRTTLRAALPATAPSRVCVGPARTTWAMAAAVLGRRVRTGDVEFDRAYSVTSDPRRTARTPVDAAARAALLAVRHRAPRLVRDGREVFLEMDGAELDQPALLDLVDALVCPPERDAAPYR